MATCCLEEWVEIVLCTLILLHKGTKMGILFEELSLWLFVRLLLFLHKDRVKTLRVLLKKGEEIIQHVNYTHCVIQKKLCSSEKGWWYNSVCLRANNLSHLFPLSDSIEGIYNLILPPKYVDYIYKVKKIKK